jgi:glutamate formiminotransferase
MQEIVECVMNISEGRVIAKINAIADEIRANQHAFLLNTSSDPDHNRTVLSFIGTPSSISDAAFAATTKAIALIDLTQHRGVHPRIGAVDVIPFVPVQGVSMEDCVKIAHRLAEKIGRILEIPVYLYGEAAIRPAFENLAHIREGAFEKLGATITQNPGRKPDFGPIRNHPTAGGVAVGARQTLIAFNVYLKSSEVEIAREIAATIRESGGGLPGVKALGFHIAHRDRAQVSMNVMNYRRSSLLKIFKSICEEAHRLEVEVDSSEIVGLVPRDALGEDAVEALRLKDFAPDQILEHCIEKVMEDRR